MGGASLTVAGTAATALAETTVGMAVTSAATGAGAAIGSTTVGAAIIVGADTVLTGAAAAVSAVATAPILPFVCLCAGIGFLGKWVKSI